MLQLLPAGNNRLTHWTMGPTCHLYTTPKVITFPVLQNLLILKLVVSEVEPRSLTHLPKSPYSPAECSI